jgi:mannose-6-phosphate isomerase-like protein (cupin superfamily)
MNDSQVGRLTLDPGGEISLRWTKAWNGLLTIKGQDFRASHSHHVHDYYSICLVDHGEAEVIARGESFHVRPGSVILIRLTRFTPKRAIGQLGGPSVE